MTRLFHFSFYLFCIAIPISQFLSVRLLVIALLLSLFVKPRELKWDVNASWDVYLYLLVLVVGLTYTTDWISGLKVLETNFCLAAIPLLAHKLQFNDESRTDRAIRFFCLGLFVSSVVCLVYAAFRFLSLGVSDAFYFYELTRIVGFTPTYFAYFLIFGITCTLYFAFYNERKRGVFIAMLLSIFFFLVLLLTGGKTTFVGLIMILSFFFIRFLLEERSSQKQLTIAIVACMLICIFVTNLYDGPRRSDELSDTWDRILLWETTLKVAPDVIFGVGTGDYKSELTKYFSQAGLHQYAAENFNSHNQLLQLLFTHGLFGIIAFTLLMTRPLYMAVKTQNTLAILSMFPFVVYGINEVFMSRYQGVVFFVFVHQIFSYANFNSLSSLGGKKTLSK